MASRGRKRESQTSLEKKDHSIQQANPFREGNSQERTGQPPKLGRREDGVQIFLLETTRTSDFLHDLQRFSRKSRHLVEKGMTKSKCFKVVENRPVRFK